MDLDRSFKDQTSRMGDVHHWAWRANRAHEARYIDARDAARCAGGAGGRGAAPRIDDGAAG